MVEGKGVNRSSAIIALAWMCLSVALVVSLAEIGTADTRASSNSIPRVKSHSCGSLSHIGGSLSHIGSRLDPLNRRGTLNLGSHTCSGEDEAQCP